MISNIEAGRVGVSEDRFRRLVSHYRVRDAALVEVLARMARERKGQWWEDYRAALPSGFADLAEMEHHAVRLRTAQMVHMPGLLQTEDHARAVFELAVPPLSRLEVELRVAHRMRRQAILQREAPPQYLAIVHEAVLRIGFGGRRIARAQLSHILEATEQEHVTILVIPFGPDGFPGDGHTIGYAEGPVPQLDVVQVDTEHGMVFLGSPGQLANYRDLLDRMEGVALGPAESRELIHKVKEDW